MRSRWAWLEKYAIAATIIMLGFAVTPTLKQMAYMERGYHGSGGEYAPLILSFVIAAFVLQVYRGNEPKKGRFIRRKRKGCMAGENEVLAVRPQFERPSVSSTRIRESLCIEVKHNSVKIIAHAPVATQEKEGGARYLAITVVDGFIPAERR